MDAFTECILCIIVLSGFGFGILLMSAIPSFFIGRILYAAGKRRAGFWLMASSGLMDRKLPYYCPYGDCYDTHCKIWNCPRYHCKNCIYCPDPAAPADETK